MTYDEVFTFEHIYKSYKKSLKGVRWKAESQRFILNENKYCNKIYRILKQRKYKSDSLKKFDIMERGKLRHIQAHTFKDRVVQKCFCDYCLTPLLSKQLIYDCGATLKNKGIIFSQKRTDAHLHKYYRKYGCNGYCLTIDIHHYFESISHKTLLGLVSKKITDKELLLFLQNLLKLFESDYGLGLGSQISQICALIYLNKIDHYIKENLKIKYYGRYMDDLYLINHNKNYLYFCLEKIREKLLILNLTLNKKTKIHLLNNGFIFTKIKYILTSTGKVLHIITTGTFKSMKRKIKRGIDLKPIIPSWYAYLDKFNCYYKKKNFIAKNISKFSY